jgi:hypothetical protein
MQVGIEKIKDISKETENINNRIFREELKKLSKKQVIDRLMEFCQMNGIFGMIILVSIISEPLNLDKSNSSP